LEYNRAIELEIKGIKMNCNPTITAKEFTTIHNGLCDLESAVRQLEDVLSPALFLRLAKAASDIRGGLAGAYEQDSADFDRKSDGYDAVKNDNDFGSVWSIYSVENLADTHSYPADAVVVYGRAHCAVEGGTWVDLYRAADNCIRLSGDDHHIYIEGFELRNGNELHLVTGS
jgi:hypothetical protein